MKQSTAQFARALAKFVLVAVVFAVAGVAAWRYDRPLAELTAAAGSISTVKLWLTIILLYGAASTIPMPGRDLLKFLSAGVLGYWSIVAIWLGEMLAAAAGYWLARFGGRDLVALLFGKRLEPFNRKLQNATWRSIFALRVLPVTVYRYLNYGAGLVDLPFAPYFVGSLGGIFVRTAVFQALFTAFADQLKDRGLTLWQTFVASLVIAPAMLGVWWLGRRWKNRRGAPTPDARADSATGAAVAARLQPARRRNLLAGAISLAAIAALFVVGLALQKTKARSEAGVVAHADREIAVGFSGDCAAFRRAQQLYYLAMRGHIQSRDLAAKTNISGELARQCQDPLAAAALETRERLLAEGAFTFDDVKQAALARLARGDPKGALADLAKMPDNEFCLWLGAWVRRVSSVQRTANSQQ
jgi:uncharacterized membrane protein YdjX (TVP38/TMEM64 family)